MAKYFRDQAAMKDHENLKFSCSFRRISYWRNSV